MMDVLDLLHRSASTEPIPRAAGPDARNWIGTALAEREGELFFDFDDAMRAEIRAAVRHCRDNGLDLDTMEQEDFRVPSFARHVERLRAQLDDGPGVLILRGLDVETYDEPAADMITWGLGNYLGRPMRQGLRSDRRLFTVTDRGADNRDATRIGATSGESFPHTDNGCLEPRPPCYIGLLCYQTADIGGDSRVLSAAAVHDLLHAEQPDMLQLLYQIHHFKPPHLHTWPNGPRTIAKPIFERNAEGIHVHYARVMVEPGMVLAGTPLDDRQRAALDCLDAVMRRPGLAFEYRLRAGEFLWVNNLATLHGRTAYRDADQSGRRVLKRIWVWRRHRGAGVDPVGLDAIEFS